MEGRKNTEKFLHNGYLAADPPICRQIRRLAVGKPIGTDFPFSDQILQRADRFLYRKAAADIMHNHGIQIIRLHPAQRILHVLFHCRRTGVIVDGVPIAFIMEITALISPVQGAFALQDKVLSSALQCPAEQLLACTCAVNRRGINIIYAIFPTDVQQISGILYRRISVRPDTAAAKSPCA